MNGFAWKVVIHHKNPGVHQFPWRLRTFQATSPDAITLPFGSS